MSLAIFSCTRDWINPYDSDCPPEIWSPENLTAEKSLEGVLLKWQQYEKHFDGFTIERSTDSINWNNISTKLVEKEKREFTDTIYQPGSAFFYRIVAVADKNKSNYVNSLLFNFPSELPIVITNDITDIDNTSASFHGFVVDDGGEEITERGFYYEMQTGIDTSKTKIIAGAGLGEFLKLVSGLNPGQTYYVKAYAINSEGVGYGEEIEFTTLSGIAQVETYAVKNITATNATLSGQILDDGGAEITESGFYLSTDSENLLNTIPEIVMNGFDTLKLNLTNLDPGTEYFVVAFATNSEGTSSANIVSFITECNDCKYETYSDPRDGKVYKTIEIGDQIWLAENLAFLPSVNHFQDSSRIDPRYYVYNYDGNIVAEAKTTENFKKFGVLYNWEAAKSAAESIGNGWRLPTDEEWKKMESELGMSQNEIDNLGLRGTDQGTKLKYCREWEDSLFPGTDEVCFGALPAGVRGTLDFGGTPFPIGIGVGGAWWTSTPNVTPNGTYGYFRGLSSASPKVFRIDGELDFGFSVRLVKDK